MRLNGHVPEIGGAAVSRLLVPPPVVGAVRARIAYPIDSAIPPTSRGRYGRAWEVDLGYIRRQYPDLPADALVAHWMIEAPWCHQVVHSHSLLLIHLRPLPGKPPTHRWRPDATHEVHLYGIHPAAPRHRFLGYPIDPSMWLQPAAYAGQIAEPLDSAAYIRVAHAVELVLAGRLSPDPRHVWSWASLFGDDILRHAKAPPPKPSDDAEA